VVERTHDLVVLSLGMVPDPASNGSLGLPLGTDRFVAVPAPNASPCATARPGIFVTGTAMGPMDIVDSIVTASSAAAAASAYLRETEKEAIRA
jgi:heterodisulfide reductase subunit A